MHLLGVNLVDREALAEDQALELLLGHLDTQIQRLALKVKVERLRANRFVRLTNKKYTHKLALAI